MSIPGRLIEPLGLLDGKQGEAAVTAGLALPLSGGQAFSIARLITPTDERLVAISDLPPDWRPLADTLARTPTLWSRYAGTPAVMGILNVTPDSFSDGGLHCSVDAAIAAGHAMLEAGADMLDIGGESTRPGAAPVTPQEELARILPVVTALARAGATLSIDTRNAPTMRACLDAGAAIINDVTALRHDPTAAGVVAAAGCPVILMHMRGTPATMGAHATYNDLPCDVLAELADRIAAAEAAGISPDRIAIDPGIGFAKIGDQNQTLLRHTGLLRNLGRPILIGVSRKRFIGATTHTPDPATRLPGSLAAALATLALGATVLRVHDVAETVQALRIWRSIARETVT